MSCQFRVLRDEAVAAAEEGDWRTAVARFRSALTTAEAPAAGSGLASSPTPIQGTVDTRHVLLPTAEENAAAHDMLAQCLMSLAMAQTATEVVAGSKQDVTEVVPGSGDQHDLWQEALAHAAQATSTRPNWPPALLTYGRCLRNVGLLDEALRVLNSAAEVIQSPSGPARGGCTHTPHSRAPPSPVGKSSASLAAAPGWDAELEAEVQAELDEVGELWAQRLARQVGLPGLRLMQDAGATLGGGPGRRVWECSVLLAAYLVANSSSCTAAAAAAATRTAAPNSGGGGKGISAQAASAAGAAVVWPGDRVLELGCGSGLAGIAAAAACGARCVLTDLPAVVPAATACAAANAELVVARGGCVAVHSLDWEDVSGPAAAAAAAWLGHGGGEWGCAGLERCQDGQRKEGASANGGSRVGAAVQECGSSRCAWVLGADLVYSAAQVGPFVDMLKGLRAACAASPVDGQAAVCRLLLAHKHRSEAVSQKLFDALLGAGIRLQGLGFDTGSTHAIAVAELAVGMPSVALYVADLW